MLPGTRLLLRHISPSTSLTPELTHIMRESRGYRFLSAQAHQQAKSAPETAASPTAITDTTPSAMTDAASPSAMTDAAILEGIRNGSIRAYSLEQRLGPNELERAVKLRRQTLGPEISAKMADLPLEHFDYASVVGQCCENVIGYMPVPVGVAGPLLVDGEIFHIPMATTEGALVASTTRGCKAITESGGMATQILADGMSRAPVLSAPDLKTAMEVKRFIEREFDSLAARFVELSRFTRLKSVKTHIAGRKLFVRFVCTTGDAMGMNMIGQGVEHALGLITEKFPDVAVLSLSGNMCTDKKPSAINWIEGRGKSVSCEAIIKGEIVERVLKTTVSNLVELNYGKNLVGSAMAGSIGGFNAHASNLVSAVFLATGQDIAQNVEASSCITLIEPINDWQDLYISCTLPCMEVGTVGGGTSLRPQASMLKLLGCKEEREPGENAQRLARAVAATVLAGELSLMSALSVGHLISSHLTLNRKSQASWGPPPGVITRAAPQQPLAPPTSSVAAEQLQVEAEAPSFLSSLVSGWKAFTPEQKKRDNHNKKE